MQTQSEPTSAPVPAHPFQRQLFTVEEFVKLPEFNYLSQAALRHLIFNGKSRFGSGGQKIAGNGLYEAGAVVRLGRKIMIDAAKFREWVFAQSKTG